MYALGSTQRWPAYVLKDSFETAHFQVTGSTVGAYTYMFLSEKLFTNVNVLFVQARTLTPHVSSNLVVSY